MRKSLLCAVALSVVATVAGCSANSADPVASSASSAICTNANSPAPCAPGQTCIGPANDSQYFPQTGLTVRGAFLDYMKQTGGITGTGYPLSNVFQSVSGDGKSHYTQCFERQVLEFHEENFDKCQYTVQGRQLGKDRYLQKYGPGGAPGQQAHFAPTPTPLRLEDHPFSETGFVVEPAMYEWWSLNGGLDAIGFPISQYFEEESPEEPGKRYFVQYFERAVGEYHPRGDGFYEGKGQLLGKYAPECPNIGPVNDVKTTLVSARSAAVLAASWWTASTIGGKQSIAAFTTSGKLVVRITQAKDGDGHEGMEVFPSKNLSGAKYTAADVAKILAAYSNDNDGVDGLDCLGAIAHLFVSSVATVLECKDSLESGDATFCSNELETYPDDVAEVGKACWSDKDPTARGTRSSCELLNNGIFDTVGENCNGDLSCTCYVVGQ